MKNKNNNKTAFTFIELSLVLIIVGLAVGIVMASAGLVASVRLGVARSMTAKSPVNDIPGLVLWLDSVSKSSFEPAQISYPGIFSSQLNVWYDLNPQMSVKNNATQSSAFYKPVYLTNMINGLPAVNFSTLNGGQYKFMMVANESNFDLPSFSIFMVSNGSGTFISKNDNSSGTTTRRKLQLNQTNFSSGTDSDSIALTGSDSGTHIRAVISSSNTSHKYWIDGTSNSSGTTLYNDQLNNLRLQIGAAFGDTSEGLTGNIGEIIIFNRALSDAEALDVIDYLSKKWRIPIR